MKFIIGDKVSISLPLPYLKTADAMPMLRPPDLVGQEEIGVVVEIRSAEIVAVRFRRGTFLISADKLERPDNIS